MSQFGTREKLITATSLVAVLLVSIALVSLISFSNTQQKLERVTEQYQPKMLSAMQLTTHFYHSLSVLGNYMVEQDQDSIALYGEKVADIDATLDELIELTRLNEEPRDANQLQVIRTLVDEIKAHNQQMLEFASNLKRNMPAMGIAADWMEPLSQEMTHVLNEISLESDQQGLQKTGELNDALLYNWAMVISQLRSYLAFRNDSAIAEMNLYLEGVDQYQRELRDELLREQPTLLELLDEFTQQLMDYRAYLNQVVGIHSGSDWRADSHLMRTSITPTLKNLTLELESLVGAQKARIQASNRELAHQIQSAERTIRISIQIAMLVSAVVIILTLRNRGLLSEIIIHKHQKAQAEHKARHDVLTKLPNRAYFDEQLRSILWDTGRTRSLALLFIDLDGFKAVNDSVGHDAGDHVLRESSRRLQNLMGSGEMVARLGGDEFVVLIDNVVQREEVETLASRICTSLREPFPFKGKKLQIGCSIGVLILDGKEMSTNTLPLDDYFSSVLKCADEAMYQAKRGGKNRYCVYGDRHLKLA